MMNPTSRKHFCDSSPNPKPPPPPPPCRYGQQKYFMRLCGLSRTYYLLEGDPDFDTSIKGEGSLGVD